MTVTDVILILFVVVAAYVAVRVWWPFDRIRHIVSRHIGAEAKGLQTLSRPFAKIDLPNIERALRAMAPDGRRFGIDGGMFSMPMGDELGGILSSNKRAIGVRTESVDVGPDETMVCMVNGLILVKTPGRAVVYVRVEAMLGTLEVQVAAKDAFTAEAILNQIGAACGSDSVYKGRIISLSCDTVAKRGGSCISLQFHTTPNLAEEDLILPAQTLSLIERNTVGFFRTIDKMRETGRSVKKGLLLYGRPGTGKTMTAKWIAAAVPGLTTFFLSADQLFLITDCCKMARMLAPSMIVLEDVDLVARDRGQEENIHSRITLNQLLNEMDGIGNNAGVLFLLTSNRPEELENALAARPGRVDQAIEYPLPDEDCRLRLLEKYLSGLATDSLDLKDLVARTEGAPPAFIEELVRKALSLSLMEAQSTPLRQEHFRAALEELLFTGGDLTGKLLGFSDAVLDTRLV